MEREYLPLGCKTIDCPRPTGKFESPQKADFEMGVSHGKYLILNLCGNETEGRCSLSEHPCPYHGKSHSALKDLLFPEIDARGLTPIVEG